MILTRSACRTLLGRWMGAMYAMLVRKLYEVAGAPQRGSKKKVEAQVSWLTNAPKEDMMQLIRNGDKMRSIKTLGGGEGLR